MVDLYAFETVFGDKEDITYDNRIAEQIIRNRRWLENVLFFDRLLHALGLAKASKSYPPRSNQELKNLHQRIISCDSPDHHKHSLLYYMLKDLTNANQSPEEFARSCFLANKYQTFIDGIWLMDKLQFEEALDHLTDPSLVPTFSDEILYTLCKHTPNDDTALPIAYFQTVSPAISSNHVLETFFTIMCRSSITEAFRFSQRYGDLIHRRLFEKLLTFVHADAGSTTRATRGVELINLPLNESEVVWLEDFLAQGKGKTLYGASDTIMMRKVAVGQVQNISDDGRNRSGPKIGGVNWTILTDSLRHGLGPRDVIF